MPTTKHAAPAAEQANGPEVERVDPILATVLESARTRARMMRVAADNIEAFATEQVYGHHNLRPGVDIVTEDGRIVRRREPETPPSNGRPPTEGS